jgi:hypothetical protein
MLVSKRHPPGRWLYGLFLSQGGRNQKSEKSIAAIRNLDLRLIKKPNATD